MSDSRDRFAEAMGWTRAEADVVLNAVGDHRTRIERLFVLAAAEEMRSIGKRLGLPIPLPDSVVEHLQSSATKIVGDMPDETIAKLSTATDTVLLKVLGDIARKGLGEARTKQDSTGLPS